MKKKLLRQLVAISKHLLYGTLIQCILINIVLASPTEAQTVKSVRDVEFTLEKQNISLSALFSEIESKTDFKFSYYSGVFNPNQQIDLKFRSGSIYDILMEVSKVAKLKFKQINNNIKIEKRLKAINEQSIEIVIDGQVISGKVVSGETQEPLPGVNVLIKGTTIGTVTDIDGNYSLDVPDGTILIFSSVGFVSQEIEVSGQTFINVSLMIDLTSLEEIVVTSFGIEKEKKELTYSTQEVDGQEVALAGNNNVLNGLQGKIAGVSIIRESGMPGRSPIIKIRGNRSITGNNQPLYVVDGAPISGRIEDINPNIIESINVLKGPTASALYGLRASNGVVIITTKKGMGTGAPSVTLENFYSVDRVSKLPDLQLSYAQGNNGAFNPNHPFSWGPLISELGTYTNQLGEQEQARAYDNDKEFYQSGSTFNTNVSVSNSGEIGSYFLGIGHNRQKGIIPGSDLRRTNLNFNGSFKVSPKFTTSISVNYTDQNVNDYPDLTGNTNYFRSLTDAPPSYNLAGKPFADPTDPFRQIYFRSSQNNPYWVINHNYRKSKAPRTFGNVFLNYKINDALSINYRLAVDNINSRTEDFQDLGTGPQGRSTPPSGGRISILNDRSTQVNSNLFVSFKKQLKENLMLDAVIGNELFDQRFNGETSAGNNFSTGGWANLANASIISASNSVTRQRIVGFYGNLNLGWQDKVFLNASGRNDYVSNMPSTNRSFFYPSIGVSLVLTNIVPELNQVMSFGKLRATFAEVGQAGPIFVNGTGFINKNLGGFVFPFNGVTSFTQQGTRINANLEPENTRSFEIGLDLRFFDDRVSLDYTYFNSTSEGQIFEVPLAFSTGAETEIRNAGEISSSGHEIILNLIPIRTATFSWNFSANFSTLNNKVDNLSDGIERVSITRVNGLDLIVAEKGYDFPSIRARGYLKDPNTGLDVIESDPNASGFGFPILDPEQRIVGSPIPDFQLNFGNSLTYKSFSLTFQIDWRSGGDMVSMSYIETRWRGLNDITLDRDQDDIIPGVKGTIVDGDLTVQGPNDIPIKKNFAYYNGIGAFNATEQALQDASFVRLREATLNYEFPAQLLNKVFLKSATVYLSGRNLFLITDAFTDPEVNFSDGQSANSAGVEISQIPQTRSFGAGIRFTF